MFYLFIQVIHSKAPKLFKNKCITDEGLAQRLWTVFQYNGYISNKLSFPKLDNFSQDNFKQAALAAADKSITPEMGGKDALKQQKREALENAFKNIPKDLMKQIANRYDLDFKLFGYKPWPLTWY